MFFGNCDNGNQCDQRRRVDDNGPNNSSMWGPLFSATPERSANIRSDDSPKSPTPPHSPRPPLSPPLSRRSPLSPRPRSSPPPPPFPVPPPSPTPHTTTTITEKTTTITTTTTEKLSPIRKESSTDKDTTLPPTATTTRITTKTVTTTTTSETHQRKEHTTHNKDRRFLPVVLPTVTTKTVTTTETTTETCSPVLLNSKEEDEDGCADKDTIFEKNRCRPSSPSTPPPKPLTPPPSPPQTPPPSRTPSPLPPPPPPPPKSGSGQFGEKDSALDDSPVTPPLEHLETPTELSSVTAPPEHLETSTELSSVTPPPEHLETPTESPLVTPPPEHLETPTESPLVTPPPEHLETPTESPLVTPPPSPPPPIPTSQLPKTPPLEHTPTTTTSEPLTPPQSPFTPPPSPPPVELSTTLSTLARASSLPPLPPPKPPRRPPSPPRSPSPTPLEPIYENKEGLNTDENEGSDERAIFGNNQGDSLALSGGDCVDLGCSTSKAKSFASAKLIHKTDWLDGEKSEDELQKLFEKTVGEEKGMCWHQLKEVLDTAMRRDMSKDVCRSLTAMLDTEYSGKFGFEEFKQLWNEIKHLKVVFNHFDITGSGYLSSFELREAFNYAGYDLDHQILNTLRYRYSTKNGKITFDDFLLSAIRLRTTIGAFKKKDPKNQNVATFTLDEWILKTLYL